MWFLFAGAVSDVEMQEHYDEFFEVSDPVCLQRPNAGAFEPSDYATMGVCVCVCVRPSVLMTSVRESLSLGQKWDYNMFFSLI